MPRIMLIHAVAEAVVPIRQAFAADWPVAETHDLMDTSLSADLAIAITNLTIRRKQEIHARDRQGR